jgi:hypothetical protein
MALTKNFEYQGPDQPGSTVAPSDLNPHINIRRINAMADVSDKLTAGILCSLTGTTNASDMTQVAATYGRTSEGGKLYVVDVVKWSPYWAATTTRAVYPNRITNATATLTDYTHTANTNIVVIPVEIGMRVWLLGSTNGTWDTEKDKDYYPANDGFIEAPADPDGNAIDQTGHCFRSIATTVNQNWCLCEYVGRAAHDKTP